MDPLIPAAALKIVGGKMVLPVMKHFAAKLAGAGDAAWQERRREIHEDWQIEAATLAQERFDFLSARVDDLEAKVAVRAEEVAAIAVHANFVRAADAEPTEERRRMLAFADAALVDTSLTVAQISRVERLLRELDPEDILWLSVIDRAAGTFFEGIQKGSEERVRWETWNRAGADVLVASGCVRVTHHSQSGAFAYDAPAGGGGWDGAVVTREGRLVLQVMRLFLRARPLPMVPPGRETQLGDCSEGHALARINAVAGLRSHVLRLATGSPTRYDFPKRHFEEGTPAAPHTKGLLLVRRAPATAAEGAAREAACPGANVATAYSPGEEIYVDAVPDDEGDPERRVLHIRGPHDVLRWLADEVDARWV
jgi:hypothetical protein